MMGAGIAHANAARGIACVLKDVSLDKAGAGFDGVAKIIAPQVAKGRVSEVEQARCSASSLRRRTSPTCAAAT